MFHMADAGRPFPRAAGRRGLAPIRAVIGDIDSARQAFVSNILSHQPDVQVVAAPHDGNEVIEAIESYRPDVVFLAVQMPQADAFRVIEKIGSGAMPPVVFIATKHDFAVRAFDVRALDYLVEPLSRRRVEQAIGRAREHVRHEQLLAAAGRLLAQASRQDSHDAPLKRLAVRSGNRVMFVDPAAIDWIEAEGNYVRLHLGTKSYRVRKTMADMESELGAQQVARIHRRILIRVDRVRELRLKARGRCDAVLESGLTLPVSRTYRVALQKRLVRK
jgi:two-component system, LytTR family, response regulator